MTFSLTKQLLAMLTASTAAIAANIVLYYFITGIMGIRLVALEQYPPPEVVPLPVTDVILFSFIFSAGGCLVFFIVANTTDRPQQIFIGISMIVLVLSIILPFRIPTPPVPMSTKWSLVSMHILGAAVLVPLLVVIGLPKKSHEE